MSRSLAKATLHPLCEAKTISTLILFEDTSVCEEHLGPLPTQMALRITFGRTSMCALLESVLAATSERHHFQQRDVILLVSLLPFCVTATRHKG